MDTHHIELFYGRGVLPIELTRRVQPTVIRKAALPKLPDASAAVRRTFESPASSKSLSELAKGRVSACILVCDITRPVPNGLFLRPMIEIMVESGIPIDQIVVLVATGLHRPNEGEELAELIGDPWVLEHVRVENHFARNSDDHIDFGRTSTRGTPVSIDRRFAEADLRIATGLVEPHFMAGWSGGRKVVVPGVAHHETIRTFHSARFMEDPLAVQCNLVGNALHEEQLEIVRMLGDVYGLNTVLDEERNLVFVSFGEIVAGHAAAVEFVNSATRVGLPRKFSTVVTSSAGYPLDKTYYQTIKGMVTPLAILEPGGTLIIASECSEGFGSREFREAQTRLVSLGQERFLATLTAKTLAEVDEWQTEMQLKSLRIGRVELYTSGLTAADQALTGVHVVSDLDSAIAASLLRSRDPAVAVIP